MEPKKSRQNVVWLLRKNLLRVRSRAFSDKTEQFSRALILISKTQARACAAKTNAAAHTGKNEWK